MIETFTIETEEVIGVEAEIRDVNARAMELRPADPQAALDWLNQFEHLVEDVSVTRQGRFHNQRALALEALKEYDRAILEFDRAAYCFEQSGETELRGMVHNNIARTYSLLGNYIRAHESVDIALALTTDIEHKIQWGDQLANILTDEGKLEEAETECDRVLTLLVGAEQFGLLAECLSTKQRIEQQKHGTCVRNRSMLNPHPTDSPALSHSLDRGEPMLTTPLQCVQHALSLNPNLAGTLFVLMAMIIDPNGDPDIYGGADDAMQFLFAFTPRGEEEYRAEVDRITHKPEVVSESSS